MEYTYVTILAQVCHGQVPACLSLAACEIRAAALLDEGLHDLSMAIAASKHERGKATRLHLYIKAGGGGTSMLI